jgi:hypothetical protein
VSTPRKFVCAEMSSIIISWCLSKQIRFATERLRRPQLRPQPRVLIFQTVASRSVHHRDVEVQLAEHHNVETLLMTGVEFVP